jgi:hypothetical protein
MSVASLSGGKEAVYIHFKSTDLAAAADVVTVRILENATFTGTAATFTAVNSNRVRKTASAITLTGTLDASVTTTSAVTLRTMVARGSSGGAARYVSAVGMAQEIVFNPGTQYLLEFSPAGATAIDYELFWYETGKS